jgi:hypothetical protein
MADSIREVISWERTISSSSLNETLPVSRFPISKGPGFSLIKSQIIRPIIAATKIYGRIKRKCSYQTVGRIISKQPLRITGCILRTTSA